MIAIYIIVPILILFTLFIINGVKTKRRKYAEWLLELNQWEVDDVVELLYDNYEKYYDISDMSSYTATAFANYTKEKYKQKYPNSNRIRAFAKLVKWNETDTVLEYFDGSTSYISTKFIHKNLSFIKRTKDKGMDTFILSKKEKIRQMRTKKLIRVMGENLDE